MANADPIKSHMAYNEAAKPSFGNPEPLKTLDEILEEKAASEGEESYRSAQTQRQVMMLPSRNWQKNGKNKNNCWGKRKPRKSSRPTTWQNEGHPSPIPWLTGAITGCLRLYIPVSRGVRW